MLVRFLILTAILSQISGCIATPRIFSPYSSEYEPPEHSQPQPEAQQQKPKLSDESKEEIRKQVQEELARQNSAQQPAK